MLKEPVVTAKDVSESEGYSWRRQCGCLRTSEKLKNILKRFPPPPPPSPKKENAVECNPYKCRRNRANSPVEFSCCGSVAEKKTCSVSWQVILELVQLVQLSVTATALALYYLIYCYMQLVYYTLRTAIYFHKADLPMKITIGFVMTTTILLAFNLLLKIERLIGILT